MWACVIRAWPPPPQPTILFVLSVHCTSAALQLIPREEAGVLGLWAAACGAVPLNQECQMPLCCISECQRLRVQGHLVFESLSLGTRTFLPRRGNRSVWRECKLSDLLIPHPALPTNSPATAWVSRIKASMPSPLPTLKSLLTHSSILQSGFRGTLEMIC